MAGITTFTPKHPVFKLPDLQKVLNQLKSGDPEIVEMLAAREAAIQLEKEDPYRGVHVLESWELHPPRRSWLDNGPIRQENNERTFAGAVP